MTRVQLVLVAGLAVIIGTSTTLLHHQAEFDAEKQSAPPHVARPAAGVPQDYPDVVGAQADAVTTWVQEREREAREQQERDAAVAEAERLEAARRAAVPAPASSRAPTSCDGHIIPGYILQRESGCDYGAVNPTGCSGYSCVGLYQFDLRHFTSGACRDLDWRSPGDQDECARRLSNDGKNLAPWGG